MTASCELVSLLQQSIGYVQREEIHPVLYQTLGALHHYVEKIGGGSTENATPNNNIRPSFSTLNTAGTDKDGSTVLAFGWMEQLRGRNYESVLLRLLQNGVEKEMNLVVAREDLRGGDELEVLDTFSLSDVVSCEAHNRYGDPKLHLLTTNTTSKFVFRCDRAQAWQAELELHLETEEDNTEAPPPAEELLEIPPLGVEVERSASNKDIVHDDVGSSHRVTVRRSSTSSTKTAEDTSPGEDETEEEEEENEELETVVPTTTKGVSPDREEKKSEHHDETQAEIPKRSTVDPSATRSVTKQTPEAQKPQSTTPKPAATPIPLAADKPQPTSPMATKLQQQQQHQPTPQAKSPTQPTRPAKTSTRHTAGTSTMDWFGAEQQKKAAAEKRRQLVDLQRKFARVQQQGKDLAEKKKFLLHEQHKQQIKLTAATKHNKTNPEAALLVQQLAQQLVSLEEQGKAKQQEATQLQAQIQQHHNKPLSSFVKKPAGISATLSPQQQQEQAKANWEQQRKQVQERHRSQVEQQRKLARQEQERKERLQKQRFMEVEQRKQQLREQAARKSKSGAKDMFSQKLESQMSAFNTKPKVPPVSDTAKDSSENNATPAEEDDPEVVRKKIAEQARQRVVQEDLKGNLIPEPVVQSSSFDSSPAKAPPPQRHYSPRTSSPSQHYAAANTANQAAAAPYGTMHGNGSQKYRQQHGSHPQAQQHPRQTPAHGHSPSPAYNTNQSQPRPTAASNQQAPPPTNPTPRQQSGSDEKYSKMAQQNSASEDTPDDTAVKTELKRKILVTWALLPPAMNCLRPIDQLLCNVQLAYPEALGLDWHEYFDGWKAISPSELVDSSGMALDEKKLSKAVRKLRFFLHPDKLPRDLTPHHGFLCKILWDVINDSWEDYKKAQEELDWLK